MLAWAAQPMQFPMDYSLYPWIWLDDPASVTSASRNYHHIFIFVRPPATAAEDPAGTSHLVARLNLAGTSHLVARLQDDLNRFNFLVNSEQATLDDAWDCIIHVWLYDSACTVPQR